MDRLADIEARIAQLEKIREAEEARERRVFESVAAVYAEREKVGLGALGPLVEKLRLKPEDIEQFFKAEEQEAKRTVEAVTPRLQLTKDEIGLIAKRTRAILLIDPCVIVPPRSPGWKCAHHAVSCDSTHWETANASGSCVCDTPKNECNPKVDAYGQGLKGWRSAYVHSWCWFDIPARPHATTVTVYSLVDLHGFYILRPATAMAAAEFSLELEMTGWQYGWSWASATLPVLSLSGDHTGRYDAMRTLQFTMPVGADPFQVRVSAKLKASAKGGGSLAVGNFATAAGNFIKTFWVNTYSPD